MTRTEQYIYTEVRNAKGHNLDMSGVQFDDRELDSLIRELNQKPHLKVITAWQCGFTDQDIEKLKQLKYVTTLNLQYNDAQAANCEALNSSLSTNKHDLDLINHLTPPKIQRSVTAPTMLKLFESPSAKPVLSHHWVQVLEENLDSLVSLTESHQHMSASDKELCNAILRTKFRKFYSIINGPDSELISPKIK